jgi:murein L,D-transpeptidase YafK
MFFVAISIDSILFYDTTPLTKVLKKQDRNKNIKLLISKKKQRLEVICEGKVLKSYPAVFGFNTKQDKLMEGDGCTPEGTFRILAKYPHKKWSKFMWLDYPNKESLAKIKKAKAEKRVSADAKPGGQIGIHGVPKGLDIFVTMGCNWTKGCISLKTRDVNDLYDGIPNDIQVVITP